MRVTALAVPAFAAAFAFAAPALADDDDYGAYLFEGSCSSYAANQVIGDVGDLDIETGATKEWARVAPAGAAMPSPLWIEDETLRNISPADIAGGVAIAVTDDDIPTARVIACGEIPPGTELPYTGDLAEVDGSGTVGRVAIEARKGGVRVTTAAFAKGTVPAQQ